MSAISFLVFSTFLNHLFMAYRAQTISSIGSFSDHLQFECVFSAVRCRWNWRVRKSFHAAYAPQNYDDRISAGNNVDVILKLVACVRIHSSESIVYTQ